MSEPLILKLQNRIKELENKSAISVYNNATQDISKGTENIVNFNSIESKRGNDFELKNNNLICKKTGLIAINYKIHLNANFGDNNNIIVKLFKNNNEAFRFQYRPSGNAGQTFSSELRILEVAENDEINMKFINYSGNTQIGNASTVMENSINAFYL